MAVIKKRELVKHNVVKLQYVVLASSLVAWGVEYQAGITSVLPAKLQPLVLPALALVTIIIHVFFPGIKAVAMQMGIATDTDTDDAADTAIADGTTAAATDTTPTPPTAGGPQ